MVVELRTVSGRIVRKERAAKAVTSAGQRGLNTGDRRRYSTIERDHPAKRGLGGGQERRNYVTGDPRPGSIQPKFLGNALI
jgi:hypothetical protein